MELPIADSKQESALIVKTHSKGTTHFSLFGNVLYITIFVTDTLG